MKISIVFTLLFISVVSEAQPLSISDSITLYNGGSIIQDSQTITLAAPNYERALELSRRTQDKDGEFQAILNIGHRAVDQGYLEEALIDFQQAYSIAEVLNDPVKLSSSTGAIGNVYFSLKNFDLAANYYKEALDLSGPQKDSRNAFLLCNLSSAYIKLEKSDSAVIFLNQALDIFETQENQIGVIYVLNNMGVYYSQKGQFEMALEYYEQILANESIDSDLLTKGGTYMNIGGVYAELKNFAKAEEYFKKALEIDQNNNFRNREYFKYLAFAKLYQDMDDYERAFVYLRKHYLLKDSITGAENQERVAELEMQYDLVHKEKELLESQRKIFNLEEKQATSRLKYTVIILSLILLLIVGGYFIKRLGQNRKKLTEENQQMTEDLEAFREKLNLVKGELETKNQDLTDFALDISRKNEIAAKLVAALNKVERHLNTKTSEDFKALKSLVNSHNQVNEDISIFQENIETINNEFFKSLKKAYPALTKNEMQLCGLLRLDLSIKEIATMRNVAPKTIEMSRYRLRKKLNLKTGDDLVAFLMDFNLISPD